MDCEYRNHGAHHRLALLRPRGEWSGDGLGRVALHQADGVAFLAAAEDEVYDVLMIDLDMGSLFRAGEGARAARQAARDVYRVLSERGLLIVNEYSESAAHERIEAMLRSVRALRHHFAEVHVVRTTPHNLLSGSAFSGATSKLWKSEARRAALD